MTGIATRTLTTIGLLALAGAGFAGVAHAAVTVMVKNDGPAAVQIGFDNAAAKTVAPRATERFSLDAGELSAQCRYEGGYDGCNLEGRFTLADSKTRTFSLRPFFTAQHAVALVQQSQLIVETRPDQTWATNTRDVAGVAGDCADYQAGKLAEVSRRLQGRSQLGSVTLVTQNLCGEERAAFAATVNGAQLFFPVRSVTFKDKNGRLVLVRQ